MTDAPVAEGRSAPPAALARARAAHAVVALLAWTGLGIDVVQTTAQSWGAGLATAYLDLFSYFTIMTTTLVAVVSTLLAADPVRDGRALRVLRLDALVCVVLTGGVYHLLLAADHSPTGFSAVSNALEHTVVPLAAVAVWLAVGPRPRTDVRTVALAVLLPLAWVVWTFGRGALTSRYPYPFLDGAELGVGAALVNTAAVAVVFLVVAAGAAAVDRLLPPAPLPRGADAPAAAPSSTAV